MTHAISGLTAIKTVEVRLDKGSEVWRIFRDASDWYGADELEGRRWVVHAVSHGGTLTAEKVEAIREWAETSIPIFQEWAEDSTNPLFREEWQDRATPQLRRLLDVLPQIGAICSSEKFPVELLGADE